MKRPKSINKIAIVITGLSFGGAERVTSYLANYFIEQNWEVHLISLTSGEKAYPLSEEIHITEYQVGTSSSALKRYIGLIFRIRKTLRNLAPDVVLGMMSYSGGLACVANLGLGIPFIISERNDPYTSKGFSVMEKQVLRFLYRHFVTNAIFQSKSARSFYYKEADPRGIVIPNPLFTDCMPDPNTSLNHSHLIVSAGRLNFQKNHALLINAFAMVYQRYPEYRLIIYGEGEERPALEQLIQELKLQNSVQLPGIEREIFTKLSHAELFVLSSNFEGMPNALLEAMAMGIPCITTDYSEGRGTVITHEKNGLIVPRNNIEALAIAVLSLIEDPDKAERLGRSASQIREELNRLVVCQKWLHAVEETERTYHRA